MTKLLPLLRLPLRKEQSTNNGGSQWAREDPAGNGEAGEGERGEGEESIRGRSAIMTTTKLLPLWSLPSP